MESPAAGKRIPHNSKKRVFPESSSSMGLEAKLDASPPVNRNLKRKKMTKQKELPNSHVEELNSDSDSDDGVGVSDSYNRKDYMDCYADDYIYEDQDAILQSHFESSAMQDTTSSTVLFLQSIHPNHTASHKRSSCSSASPSLQLRSDAKKVKYVNKSLIATEFVDVPGHGEIIPMEDSKLDQDPEVAGSSLSIGNLDNNDDVMRKDQKFKRFDIVKDHSDHHYAAQNSSMMQPPKNWAKKINEEWMILEKDLPDMIFVRVYESRMDLLTAVVIGAQGTPYHDGLFFFDICFPSNYPDSPPEVYYHSGGIRINPNLYHNGKVCLSLLNTWHGASNEKWIPGASTMLQVLVSIQGLILNEKPYFNEPLVANSSGSVDEEKRSLQYNKHILILSLRTMAYNMKHPPKHFEDLVIEHFCDRAHAIFMACKAYCKGVRVGYFFDNGKDIQEGCSWGFKSNVEQCMKMLVGEFKQIGVKDLEEYMSFTQKIRAFFSVFKRG